MLIFFLISKTLMAVCENHNSTIATTKLQFVRSLAVAHVNTSNLPSRPLYWFHPCAAWLWVIGHSQWLPHGHGMLCHNVFGTCLLFPSSAEIWRPFCSGRRSLMQPDKWQCIVLYQLVCHSVLICYHVLAATYWFEWHCMVVLHSSAITPPK